MAEIIYPQLQEAVNRFEGLVASLQEYRSFLEGRRRRYDQEGRDPMYNQRVVTGNINRVNRLLELLDRDANDLLLWIVDGIGTLESVDQGVFV